MLKEPSKKSLFYFNGFKMGVSQKLNHERIFIETFWASMLLFYLFFKIEILHYINLTLLSIHSLASRHSITNYTLSCSVQWIGWLALTQYNEASPSHIDSSEQKQALLVNASECVNDFLFLLLRQSTIRMRTKLY